MFSSFFSSSINLLQFLKFWVFLNLTVWFCRITNMGENGELFRMKYVQTFPFRLTDNSIMISLRNHSGLFIL